MTLVPRTRGLADVDAFYTPPSLAKRVAAALRLGSRERASVADFAAGGGSLLAAVAQKYPTAQLFAADISPRAAARLRDSLPRSRIGVCNFLDADSRKNCEI